MHPPCCPSHQFVSQQPGLSKEGNPSKGTAGPTASYSPKLLWSKIQSFTQHLKSMQSLSLENTSKIIKHQHLTQSPHGH